MGERQKDRVVARLAIRLRALHDGLQDQTTDEKKQQQNKEKEKRSTYIVKRILSSSIVDAFCVA